MKYLSDYIREAQSEAFNKHGAFFAFGKDQFDEKAVAGVKYVQTESGMIVPKENVETLMAELSKIYEDGRAQDIAENGIDGIIRRELNNHECYYTGDISDAVDSLEYYGITREQVAIIFSAERNKSQ